MFLPVPVQFLDGLDLAALRRVVADVNPVLVVVDTQARVTVGAEENSSRDMGMFVAAADTVRTVCRACVLVVHHEGRQGDNLRGSSALEGAATTVVRSTKDGALVRLDCRKQKDAAEFAPILARLKVEGDGVHLSHDPVELIGISTESQSRLIEVLRDSFGTTGASPTQLREESGVAKTSFYRALNLLVSRGAVVKAGTEARPRYLLAKEGDSGASPTSPI